MSVVQAFSGVVPAGATQNVDVPTLGARNVRVIWKLAGTNTVGDLGNTTVREYAADGVTALDPNLPFTESGAAAISGADVVAEGVVRSYGAEKLQVRAKNNNVGPLTLTVWYSIED